MELLLIDGEGRFNNAGKASLPQLGRADGSGARAHPHMCEQGGALVAAGEAALKIEICPDHIRERTLSALMYWLADQRIERVVLAVLDGEWLHEVLPTRLLAQRRIVGLVSAARCNREGRFLTRIVDPASLGAGHAMRALLAECASGFDKRRVADILRNGMKNRFTAVRANPDSGDLVVVDMGDGYSGYTEAQRQSILATRIEDQPDYDYGRWVGSHYRARIAEGSPRIEEVDALVAWPPGDSVRHRYRRLLIPASHGGEAWLLSASLEDAGIDLRDALRGAGKIVEHLGAR